MNTFSKTIKRAISFKEPEKDEHFILKENDNEKSSSQDNESVREQKRKKNLNFLLNKDKKQKDEGQKSAEKGDISKSLSENLKYIKERFTVPDNGDFIIREFDVIVKDKAIPAFLIFYDGMVDRKGINDNLMQPLMLLSNLDIKSNEKDVATYVRDHLLPQNQLIETKKYDKVVDEVNFGGCAIFIDGVDSAFVADVKGFEHRGVERPNTELVIRGPQEGFTEIIRVNTALLRKRLKDEDMIAENVEIGERSKTPCALVYIKDIANDSLVDEVRRRLKSIKIDYLNDSGELEQFIEDSTFMPAPQISATERPDKVANLLSEGKVAVIVNGSPFVLVMPISFHEMLHSPEDTYLRYPFSILLRSIRILGLVTALLLPGLYIAITNFHQEMIPTSLLLAIEASREKVPFPSIVEILIMEISFELIREAGIRIPGPIGPTLGIIGALILGQAAVAANIISPILIIIVAVTGIGSFAFPDFSLAFAFRFLRFGYIILGVMSGFLGIATGLFIHGIWFCKSKSFGVPFMVPLGPVTKGGSVYSVFRPPVWKKEMRPDYMNPKDERRQPKISRGWIKQDSEGDGKNEE